MKRIRHLILFVSIIFSIRGHSTDYGGAFLGAVGILMNLSPGDPMRDRESENISKDMTAGRCKMEGAHCNGAVLKLYKYEKEIKTVVLTQEGLFKFSNLKEGNYIVEVRLRSLKHPVKRNVSAGQFITIQNGYKKENYLRTSY